MLFRSEGDRREVQKLMDEKYSTWEWNYGISPAFTEARRERFAWGGVEARLSVQDGRVKDCTFFGDYFGTGDYGPLLSRILGTPYTREALHEALSGFERLVNCAQVLGYGYSQSGMKATGCILPNRRKASSTKASCGGRHQDAANSRLVSTWL